MRLLQYRGIVIGVLLVLLTGAGFLGYYLKGYFTQSDTQKIEAKLTISENKLAECESDAQSAIRDAHDAAGWVALMDIEIGKVEKERKQLKQSYEDTLRVIRAMLPDRAEREIAAYYQSRQQHPR